MPLPKKQSTFQQLGEAIQDRAIDISVARAAAGDHRLRVQVEAVMALKNRVDAFRAGEDGSTQEQLLVLPTGAGKSGIAVLASYILRVSRVLLITPAVVISDQLYTAFKHDAKASERGQVPFLEMVGIATEAERADYPPSCRRLLSTKELSTMDTEAVILNAQKFVRHSKADIADLPGSFDLVIVDEAHHFPAVTWEAIVNHFRTLPGIARAKLPVVMFMTATPLRAGSVPILPGVDPCFELTFRSAVDRGLIRDTAQVTVGEATDDDGTCIESVLIEVQRQLLAHDAADASTRHRAMILAGDKTQAENIAGKWKDVAATAHHEGMGSALAYVEDVNPIHLRRFKDDDKPNGIRALVVVKRLTEGFDCSKISVVAFLRNITAAGRVTFTQFVGRAVRKRAGEPAGFQGCVCWHRRYDQAANYALFERAVIAEADPEDDGE